MKPILVSMAGCGSYSSTNETKFLEEICTRWYQLAAYMPAMYSFYEDNQYSRLPSSFSDSTGDSFLLCHEIFPLHLKFVFSKDLTSLGIQLMKLFPSSKNCIMRGPGLIKSLGFTYIHLSHL